MTPSRPALSRLKDFFVFLNVETLLVLVGTVALGLLELNVLPASWNLSDWVTDWKVLILIGISLLIVVPPPLFKARRAKRASLGDHQKSLELFAVAEAINSRTSRLIQKVREVTDGEIDNAYVRHSLSECQGFFKARRFANGKPVDVERLVIEVSYYKLTTTQGGSKLERKLRTRVGGSDISHTFSKRGTQAAKKLVEDVANGNSIWIEDLSAAGDGAGLGVPRDAQSDFACALGVPVLMSLDENPVIAGMLLVTSSSQQALSQDDERVLRSYAWHVAVAMVIDTRVGTSISPPLAAVLPIVESGTGAQS